MPAAIGFMPAMPYAPMPYGPKPAPAPMPAPARFEPTPNSSICGACRPGRAGGKEGEVVRVQGRGQEGKKECMGSAHERL
eukprot:1159725-Pelagomonas_calceolata.AAC.13